MSANRKRARFVATNHRGVRKKLPVDAMPYMYQSPYTEQSALSGRENINHAFWAQSLLQSKHCLNCRIFNMNTNFSMLAMQPNHFHMLFQINTMFHIKFPCSNSAWDQYKEGKVIKEFRVFDVKDVIFSMKCSGFILNIYIYIYIIYIDTNCRKLCLHSIRYKGFS